MLKHKTLILLISLQILTHVNAQKLTQIGEPLKFKDYMFDCTASNDRKYFAVSEGSEQTYLLDSNFKILKSFKYDFMWGGGSPTFSHDNHYLAFVKYGELSDTIAIYDLINQQLSQIPCAVENIKFMNQSNRLLFHKDGIIGLYDIGAKKFQNKLIVTDKASPSVISEFLLSNNDSFVFTTCILGKITKYSTATWQSIENLGPQLKIDHVYMSPSSKLLVFNIKNEVFVFDHQQKKLLKMIRTPYSYISEITVDPNDQYVFICSNDPEQKGLMIYDLVNKTESFPIDEINTKESGVFSVYFDIYRKAVIIGGSNTIKRYHFTYEK